MGKPHYYGHRERLRKKYLEKGVEALTDYEILELLLMFSIPVKDTKIIAKDLLKSYGSIKDIFYNLDKKECLKIKGFGEKSYILFKLINDLSKIVAKENLLSKPNISSPLDVVRYCKSLMWDLKNEEFKILFLNSKNEILEIETIEHGTTNEAYIYFRKIFEKAFNYNATAMILLHNHPSAKPDPSKEDIEVTKKIIKLADELNITVLDHIIIGDNKHFSFKENGLI